MTQLVHERNPFMLMMHPEVVLAAVAKSTRLEQLNRHMCRPLDKPAPGPAVIRDDDDAGEQVADNS